MSVWRFTYIYHNCAEKKKRWRERANAVKQPDFTVAQVDSQTTRDTLTSFGNHGFGIEEYWRPSSLITSQKKHNGDAIQRPGDWQKRINVVTWTTYPMHISCMTCAVRSRCVFVYKLLTLLCITFINKVIKLVEGFRLNFPVLFHEINGLSKVIHLMQQSIKV